MGALVVGGLALGVGFALAPWLGRALQPEAIDAWPGLTRQTAALSTLRPEPAELARFAWAVLAPVAVAALLLLRSGTGPRTRRSVPLEAVGSIAAATGVGLIVTGWITRSEPSAFGLDGRYFGDGAILVAAVIAGVTAAIALRDARTSVGSRHRVTNRAVPAVLVVAATALYTLPAMYPGRTLVGAPSLTTSHIPFSFADFTAFGNGATPLADFASQYSNFLPWLLHPVFAAFDYTPSSFTVVMSVLTFVTLLTLWRTLVLAVGSEWVGALLYGPVLALSMRPTIEVGLERTSNASLFQVMPERYLLPAVVAWLCARHLRGRRPFSPGTIFLVAVLAALNNPELGAPCVLAAFGALLAGSGLRPVSSLGRLAAHAAAGAAVSVALVAVATFLRSGSLPDPALLTYFSRLFGAQGFGLQPMPAVGFHLILYVTFVSALLVGATDRGPDPSARTMAGMLVFGGLFGLGASSYYVGRSNAITMVALFPAWGLCLALLAWRSVRWLHTIDAPRRLVTPLGLLALCSLIGVGLAVTDLSGIPSPRVQLDRLLDDDGSDAGYDRQAAAERFVATRTRPHEAVLILRGHGHLIALHAGVRNTSSIGHPFHVISATQLDELLDDLRAAGGTKVFLGDGVFIYEGLRDALRERGWQPVDDDPSASVAEWRMRPEDPAVARRPTPNADPH
ncbi:MAG: hypothetical protein ABL966_00795 [Acidimicrobiales bacterium]